MKASTSATGSVSDHATALPRILVSLTTIPARMKGLDRCMDSLAAQTCPPERIFVCIPMRYRRFEMTGPLPLDLSRFGDRVEIVRCAEDYGPGTKLLGSLDHLPTGEGALLVLVDDDMVYRPHMLESFARNFVADPRTAASFHTYRYRGVTVGQGADGFAVPVDALGGLRDYWREVRKCPESFYVDDLWISYFLWMKRVPIVDLSTHAGKQGLIYEIYNDAHALNRESGVFERRRVMRKTAAYLHRRFLWRILLGWMPGFRVIPPHGSGDAGS